jgi:hypothetical protein
MKQFAQNVESVVCDRFGAGIKLRFSHQFGPLFTIGEACIQNGRAQTRIT